MMQLAFYKNGTSWIDKIIRLVTRSIYSHVEVVLAEGTDEETGYPRIYTVAADPKVGRVRLKHIVCDPEHWDIVPVKWSVKNQLYLIDLTGSRYDYFGIILSQFFSFHRRNHKRWFCSELAAYAIGMEQPETLSPGDLYLRVKERNAIVEPYIEKEKVA